MKRPDVIFKHGESLADSTVDVVIEMARSLPNIHSVIIIGMSPDDYVIAGLISATKRPELETLLRRAATALLEKASGD